MGMRLKRQLKSFSWSSVCCRTNKLKNKKKETGNPNILKVAKWSSKYKYACYIHCNLNQKFVWNGTKNMSHEPLALSHKSCWTGVEQFKLSGCQVASGTFVHWSWHGLKCHLYVTLTPVCEVASPNDVSSIIHLIPSIIVTFLIFFLSNSR